MEMGIFEFEIFFNTFCELTKPYLRGLRREIRSSKAKVYSVHPFSSAIEPFMFFSDYERRFTDMLDLYKSYFEAARYLGANVVVIHGDKLPGRVQDEKYIERFWTIAECGAKMGVTVGQENVNLHRSQNPDFLVKMKQQMGERAKFVFDIKQSIRAGHDPYEFVQKLGDSIVHVHANDNSAVRDCLLPGKGNMDYYKMQSIMERNGSDPTWVVEVYRSDFDNLSEIRDSVQYMNELLFPEVQNAPKKRGMIWR
jgi:sugar phosphate isomerase/epimerase